MSIQGYTSCVSMWLALVLRYKIGSRVIVPEIYCLESVVHICKRVWTPLVGEKLPVDIE